ncbi:MAG: hypothetical protein Q9198_010425, partial [Flavoplaca austrocitrina]
KRQQHPPPSASQPFPVYKLLLQHPPRLHPFPHPLLLPPLNSASRITRPKPHPPLLSSHLAAGRSNPRQHGEKSSIPFSSRGTRYLLEVISLSEAALVPLRHKIWPQV